MTHPNVLNSAAGSCPIPLDEFERSTGDVNEAVGLPPAVYTDPAFFAFERRAVFASEWLCVGRTEQIPEVGDYFTVTLAGTEPVIVVREPGGTVNVMSSVCQHRGMCITAPPERPREDWFAPIPQVSGSARTFRCPYHWWIYDLEGKLLGAPSMERRRGFDKADHGLPRLRTEIWRGFIFANLDDEAPALGPRMSKIDDLLEPYGLDGWVTTPVDTHEDVPFNWKIMAENFMESYHNYGLHNRLLKKQEYGEGAAADGGYQPPYEQGDGVIVHCGVAPEIDPAVNPTQRGLFAPVAELTMEQRRQLIFAFVPPTLLVGVFPDSGFWFTVQPETVSSHTLSMGYLFPRPTVEEKLFPALLDLYDAAIQQFNSQDLPANLALQVGMESQFAPRGPLSHLDSFLPKFNAWLLERYRNADDGESRRVSNPTTNRG